MLPKVLSLGSFQVLYYNATFFGSSQVLYYTAKCFGFFQVLYYTATLSWFLSGSVLYCCILLVPFRFCTILLHSLGSFQVLYYTVALFFLSIPPTVSVDCKAAYISAPNLISKVTHRERRPLAALLGDWFWLCTFCFVCL